MTRRPILAVFAATYTKALRNQLHFHFNVSRGNAIEKSHAHKHHANWPHIRNAMLVKSVPVGIYNATSPFFIFLIVCPWLQLR